MLSLALAFAALQDKGTDYPHRDWGQVATLDMTVQDATTCIARTLSRRGDALVLPVEGGNDIDFAVRPMWGPKMEPWQTYKVRSAGERATLRLFYRHPVTAKGAGKDVRFLQKNCLKVVDLKPVEQ